MPKDFTKYLSFKTMDDVSFTRTGSQMNLHLPSGQIAEVSYDVVKESYQAMRGIQEPVSEPEVNMRSIIDEAFEPLWPQGTKNAPVWRTADDRVLPVTDMSDYHVANALRKMGTIIRSYPNTKNIHHYKQWQTWFGHELQRRHNA